MQEAIFEHIVRDIEKNGYSIQDNIFERQTLTSLRNFISQSNLKKAGISRGGIVQKDVRGDSIYWLDPQNLTLEQQTIWDFLKVLQKKLNEKLFMGIKEFEAHMTMYPRGTSYKKHFDQFKDSAHEKKRMISFILYLNENWKNVDGGELVLYAKESLEVMPTQGKMVFFLSSDFEHEVLVTERERFSLTGWLYQY